MATAVNNKGVVMIHGREYKTVAARVQEFRDANPDWSIVTELVHRDEDTVVMKALIMDDDRIVATGYAEEARASSNINKTSALENCETSAIGRALAAAGHAGTEYASADEVAGAIAAQKANELIEYQEKVREEWNSIHAIKMFLAEETPNVDAAREAFKELPHETKHILWRAPTNGGVFTTLERKLLKEGAA